MFNKLTRKGKNLAEVDNWLDDLGYYRKNVAYDETCLFRAVSEQLFDCQVYHERVRKECIAFAKENYKLFSQLVDSEESFYNRLNQLQKHMVICGMLEVHMISLKYRCDVIIFDGKKQEQKFVTNYGFSKTVLLCLMEDDHYDAIYEKEQIVTAGFCQSIVYTIFYEGVFHIQNVDDIVRNMLYEKNNLMTLSDWMKPEINEDREGEDKNNGNLELPPDALIAPFPFKVAKALDPNIYRNIEYDSWGETRRELRLGDWYYGDDKLIQGTRCIYKDPKSKEKHDCYIQEIVKDQNKCIIYLTKLALKKTVCYSDLAPEDDAKPWALPWRFTKNLTISGNSSVTLNGQNGQKSRKRGKDKKRTKSEGSLTTTLNLATADTSVNVNAFIGIPLQMQSSIEDPVQSPTINEPTENQIETCIQEELHPEEVNQGLDRCIWQQSQWQTYLPHTTESFLWPPNSSQPVPFNFSLKPMVASAPVTPDIIPYHDPRFPIYYNYHLSEPQQMYTQWSSNVDVPPQYVKSEDKLPEQQIVESAIQTETELNIKTEVVSSEENIPTSATKEKPHLAIPPQTSALEVYSPVVPIHPGTPVIYTPTLTEVPEVMVPTSPILYTPQLDVQYITPGTCPYIYPPTPPTTAWCPPAVNAQGFIFPSH